MSDNPTRVVLDTNVFVAAYWAPKSASARLIRACIDRAVQAVYTDQVKRETVAILKQIRLPESYFRYLEPIWEGAERVEPVRVDDVPIDDPDDRKFLEAAAGGEVDFLATNDDHLLSVGYIRRTEILSPGSLARVLGLL
jgi:putative PIN family toxin of toxin-antitoxin system